ncbi:Ubiquitin-like domain-containing protein [Pseudozyma hubeiensis]|nr:Ubiquitin-like domain-containing protein [Pseudozyma hubeiensis]
MEPSSDSSMPFHHHRHGQRHQPLGSSQPSSGSTSQLSRSHSQGPASPSTSTAASSNPFVRSHDDEPPTPMSGHPSGHISVAIKCPSLDKDSAVVIVSKTDTVLALKQAIQSTWAGAPRADGMRCIRSGRILSDNEVFSQLAETLESGEPLSLHLVIRPDAWSDPQNRPTPSRRNSYLRQTQHQLQHQRQNDLPRSALATQLNLQDDVQPPPSATSTEHPPNWMPTFEPYFSEADPTPAESTSHLPSLHDVHDVSASSSGTTRNMISSLAGQAEADVYTVLDEILRVTAPDNWPLLIEALSEAYDEYVMMYEVIYEQARAAQKGSTSTSSSPPLPPSQSDLLTSIETTLLGWDPVQMPNDEHASAAPQSSDTGSQYLYQQVTHRGLPYLLRISTTPLAAQRSEALSTLLQRITTLGTITSKLDNIIMLSRLIQAQPSTSASAAALGTSNPTQLNGASAAGQTMALERGGPVAFMARITRNLVAELRGVTFADVTAVIVPMVFIGFKVGILLSVMLRGADSFRWYFVLGMASVYVVFESYRIVQRRMRVRQRRAPRAAAAAPQAAAAAADVDAGAAAAPPTGSNVPTAPSNEEAAERQATETPSQPLPPPQAPQRMRSRTRFTYDWCIDSVAFIGLEVEDQELGLLASNGTTGRHIGWVERVLVSNWLLPILVFVITMMPAVEQRRKRAIEERERVIRKWTRFEQERRQRVVELQRKEAEEQGREGIAVPDEEVGVGQLEGQSKRSEYADRMLRQRRTGEEVWLDEEEEEGMRLARELQEEGDGMEDMNIF